MRLSSGELRSTRQMSAALSQEMHSVRRLTSAHSQTSEQSPSSPKSFRSSARKLKVADIQQPFQMDVVASDGHHYTVASRAQSVASVLSPLQSREASLSREPSPGAGRRARGSHQHRSR